MSFKDGSFSKRFAVMGDIAERVFEAVYPEGWVRFGINRPPINLARVPPKIRYTPDYLTGKGLVEVQGFGRDQTFKLKLEKLDALGDWHSDFRVDLFAYDSTNARYGWLRMEELADTLRAHGDLRSFPEGKKYWALHADLLPLADGWHDYMGEGILDAVTA